MLDPLPPDIRFEQLLLRPEDVEFSFAAKKEALAPHIRIRWPRDEEYQRRVHRQRFSEKPFFRIERRVEPVGTLSWVIHEDHVRFGEFYLFEKFQRAGLGTRILRHVLGLADARHLSVRLEYLKWNPVGSLYLRHGFVRTHEADIHFFLERPPRRAAKYRSARTNFSRSAALVQTFDLHIFLSGENLARPHSFCSLVMGVGDTTP